MDVIKENDKVFDYLFVVGDTHGNNTQLASHLLPNVPKESKKAILHVGDFGMGFSTHTGELDRMQHLNVKLQNHLESQYLDESVISEMEKSNLTLSKKHFRTVTLFTINNLTNNVMEHRLVPEQTVIRDGDEIKKILDENNCNAKQLPIILKHDIISKYLRLSQGDICKAKRKSIKTGEYDFYRICY